jgi:hypothetical protein
MHETAQRAHYGADDDEPDEVHVAGIPSPLGAKPPPATAG